MMENTAHARALWSQQAWCGQGMAQKSMLLNRKRVRENGGRSNQTSKCTLTVQSIVGLRKGSGKPLQS